MTTVNDHPILPAALITAPFPARLGTLAAQHPGGRLYLPGPAPL